MTIKKLFLYFAFIALVLPSQANAQGSIGGNSIFGGPTSSPSGIWKIITTASGICSKVLGGDPCTLFFGYADPRGYGGYCDDAGNNNFHDDAAGITAAWKNAYGAPVNIPAPNCKVASKMRGDRNGITLFGQALAPSYNPAGDRNSPYIFVTNDVGENLAFDYNGYDSIGVINLNWEANFGTGEGTGAVGSFYTGGARAGVDFIDFINVGIGNFGIGIGDTSTVGGGATCSPDAYPSGVLMQMSFTNLRIANGCAGIVANATDVMGNILYINSMTGPCIGSPGTSVFTLNGAISDFRCEYVGSTPGGGIQQHNGAGIWWNGSIGLELANLECDHTSGPCVDAGPSSSGLTITNGFMFNSNAYGSAPAGYDAHVVLETGAQNFNMSGVHFSDSTGHPSYGIATTGNVDYVSLTNMNTVGIGTVAATNFTGTVNHLDKRILGDYFDSNGQSVGVNLGTAAPIGTTTMQINGDLNLAASSYITFGSTDGTGGYGFRDNAGTMQWKSSGGSWANFGGGVTFPATGQVVISAGASSNPTGVAEVDGDCLVGTSGSWGASACSGSTGVNLGTSVSVTSPQRSGDAATGLYSDTAQTVQIAINGVKTVSIGSTAATIVDTLTANSFIPSSTTVPANGLYLPGANTSGIAGNSQPVAEFVGASSATTYIKFNNSATAFGTGNSVSAVNQTGSGNSILGLYAQGAGGQILIGASSDNIAFQISGGGTGMLEDIPQGGSSGIAFSSTATANIALGQAQNANDFVTGSGAGDIVLRNITGKNIAIGIGTSLAEYINSSGNIGIGTTVPITSSIMTLAGHLGYYQTTGPAVSSCGGGSLATGSTDNKGQITGISAATACTLTFNTPLPLSPACTFGSSTGIAVGGTVTSSAFTTSMALFTGTLYYLCQ